VGKSRFIAEKISAKLASTGTQSITPDPTDAPYGELRRARLGDVLLVLSNSGETAELKRLFHAARLHQFFVAAMTGRVTSSLAQATDLVLNIGMIQEACPLRLTPTTTAMLAFGDALVLIIQEDADLYHTMLMLTLSGRESRAFSNICRLASESAKALFGITRQDFARRHPGGSLGKEPLQVCDLMWPLESIPVVGPDTPLRQALSAICEESCAPGVAAVFGDHSQIIEVFTGKDAPLSVGEADNSGLRIPVVARYMQRPRRAIHHQALMREAILIFRERSTELLPVEDNYKRLVDLSSCWSSSPRQPFQGWTKEASPQCAPSAVVDIRRIL
jgi:arabinose-5-phosphate isomerase